MGYTVSSLTNYTRQNADQLVMASHFDAKTQQLILAEGNVKTKVKSSETINIISTDAVFQSDSSCGFSASGTSTITQRTVTVGKIKVQQQFCDKDLEAKYTQEALKAGSSNGEFAFEAQITEEIASTIAEQLEKALWQGDTTSGDANLSRFDGLVKLINAASGSTVAANAAAYIGTPVSGSITASNVDDIVDAMWLALPAKVQGKSDVRIFCGWDTYQKYVKALRDNNNFHYTGDTGNGEITVPGTQYKLTAVHGLDATNRLFALRMSNLHLGTDLEGEENDFKVWYSDDDMVTKLHVAFKMGINFAFPDEIVQFILA